MQNLFITLRLVIFCIIILGFAYPFLTFIIGQIFFPRQANGSLIKDENGQIIGSELIGQRIEDPKYFWPRPSAADYDALQATGSSLTLASPELREQIHARYRQFSHDGTETIPIDIITASASGLDPHISIEAAYLQIERVAKERGMNVDLLRSIIDSMIENPQFLIFGTYRINVLKLNLELDKRFEP